MNADDMDDDWAEGQQLNREANEPEPEYGCCEHCGCKPAWWRVGHGADEQCLHGCHDAPFAYRIEPDANDHPTVWVGDRAVVADYEVGLEVWSLIESYVRDQS